MLLFEGTMKNNTQMIKLIFEFTLFLLLCVPGILWAGLKKLLPLKPKSVKGEVILITGTARGLGRELAMQFAKLGAKIACVDIEVAENDETAHLIKIDGGVAISYKCDVSDKNQIKALHEQVKDDLGPVYMLINNAGIVWGHSFIDPNSEKLIENIINVNLMAQFKTIREIIPSMIQKNRGHIVAMSSMSSMTGVSGISSYTASKWAINGMMECLHSELKIINSDVKTTTILPYFVKTSPDVSKMLDIRIPELPIHDACNMMIKGILEEQRIFSVPGHNMLTISLIRLLPDNLQELFKKIFYVNIIRDAAGEEIYQKYKR